MLFFKYYLTSSDINLQFKIEDFYMKIDVLCIGNASYDLFFRLDEYPLENKKYVVREIGESCGGPASNEAFLLSKWGIKTAFTGLIGNDLYGEKIIKDFKKVKTNICFMEVRKNFPTPLSNIIINKKSGSRTIINRRSFDEKINININKFKKLKPSVLLLDGNELALSILSIDLFKEAVSILDAGSLRKETEMLAKKVDYLVCSSDFAKSYTGLKNIKTKSQMNSCMDKLKRLNKKNIIVTLGEYGVIWQSDIGTMHLCGDKVNAIDTTAAGDVFHGAFAYCILKKKNLYDALVFSIKAAGISVTREGSRDSIPGLDEVIGTGHI